MHYATDLDIRIFSTYECCISCVEPITKQINVSVTMVTPMHVHTHVDLRLPYSTHTINKYLSQERFLNKFFNNVFYFQIFSNYF